MHASISIRARRSTHGAHQVRRADLAPTVTPTMHRRGLALDVVRA
eukprot:COSAG05_NODE_17987_length_316_cov_0.548387_1_plen_44_part_01